MATCSVNVIKLQAASSVFAGKFLRQLIQLFSAHALRFFDFTLGFLLLPLCLALFGILFEAFF